MIPLAFSFSLIFSSKMHDLELFEASLIVRPDPPPSLNLASCRIPEIAFTENLRRAINLLIVPGWSFIASLAWSEAAYSAKVETVGESATEAEIKGKWKEIEALTESKLAQRAYGTDSELRRQFSTARQAMTTIIREDSGSGIHEALEAILKSIVIQVWAAYETLASDLWKSASAELSASLHVPTDAEWKSNQFGFISRRRLQKTYDFLFPVDNSDIQKATRGEDIDALALTRNVLVHSAGKVDKEFENFGKSIPLISGIASSGRSARIQFKGSLVRKLVDPVILKGYQLLGNVEDWLLKHP